MKRILVSLVLMMVLMALPAFGATQYETLRLNKENIENNLNGKIAAFKMMDSGRTSKRLEINDTALDYMIEKGINLTVETNVMTVNINPEAFKTKEWLEAVKSREPLGVRLFINKGSATKVYENFDEWYYNQIGLSRFGTSAWELTGEILVAGVKKFDVNSFAVPINVSVKYPVSAETYGVGTSNIEMYVLNESKEKWDYLGGKVDQENRIMTFDTNVPGLYTIFSNSGLNQKSQGFSDIKGHWAESDIQYMVKKNVVEMTGDKKFFPNREITRAEFAFFLARTLGLNNNDTGAKTFQDIGTAEPYYKEIMAAANSGIVAGVTENKFVPNAQITRQEIAAMMVRALKYGGIEVDLDQGVLKQFKDQGEISPWATGSCAGVANLGMMSGRSNSKFEPKSFTSRAEALVLLHRLSDKLEKL